MENNEKQQCTACCSCCTHQKHTPRSDEELKSVFADIKKQAQDDTILQAMIKAREAELKLKDEQKEIVKDEIKSNHN